MGTPVALVKIWIAHSRHGNPFVCILAFGLARSTVRRARQRASPDDVELLVALLDFPDEWIVGEAARGLSKIGGEDAIKALICHLEKPEVHNVAKVAWALGRLRAPMAVEILRTHARRGLPDAIRSLGLIGDSAAVPTLIALLESGLDIHKNSLLLREIFQAIRRLHDGRALPALKKYWVQYREIGRVNGPIWEQRDAEELVLALGEIGDVSIRVELEQVVSKFVQSLGTKKQKPIEWEPGRRSWDSQLPKTSIKTRNLGAMQVSICRLRYRQHQARWEQGMEKKRREQ